MRGVRAYLTDADTSGTGLTIVNMGSPRQLIIFGGYDSPNQFFGIDVVGTTVYLASGSAGLVILDANDPANPIEIGTFQTDSSAVDVAVQEDFDFGLVAYVISSGGGMLSLDVNDPANITQLDAEPSYGFLNAIALDRVFFPKPPSLTHSKDCER